jgi:tRNA(fMet)-specific endonuclease VapC
MNYCLDSDTLIDFLNGRQRVAARFEGVSAAHLHVSAVSVAEVLTGFEKAPGQTIAEQRFQELLAAVSVLPFELEDARIAAKIRAILEQAGFKIGPYDLQIAGQALRRGLTLVTHNVRHFKRVPGLKVEDWLA